MNRAFLGVAAALGLGLASNAQADLIVNGGFEGGVYSSTFGGRTNDSVPVGWTPNAGFDLPGNAYDFVDEGGAHSGNYKLFIGNSPGFGVPTLSQGFTTQAGAGYTVEFYIAKVAPTGYFEALIDGTPEVTVVAAPDFSSFTSTFADGRTVVTAPLPSGYTSETFSFTGTGHDTLAFTALNHSQSYAVDDVSVVPGCANGAAPRSQACGLPAALPEPAGWVPMLLGCLTTGFVVSRSKWMRRASRSKFSTIS